MQGQNSVAPNKVTIVPDPSKSMVLPVSWFTVQSSRPPRSRRSIKSTQDLLENLKTDFTEFLTKALANVKVFVLSLAQNDLGKHKSRDLESLGIKP